jgi:hypothetical protein
MFMHLSSKVEVDWLALKMKPAGQGNEEWTDRTKPLPYTERELLAMCSLLDRSWFEKLWIRQEIRLGGRNAIVLCGSHVIP